MDSRYGGVIWTKHALERLRERGISQGDAFATFNRPEQSRKASTPGAWVYYKTYGSEKIEVVASQNEKKEWVIMTVWSRPVYADGGSRPKGGSDRRNAPLVIKFLRWVFGA